MDPEAKAREKIDAMLAAAGWTVQTKDQLNLSAAPRRRALRAVRSPPASPITPSS